MPYGDGWAVKREGADRASKITDTKAEAIEAAQNIAYRNDDEIIVHNRQGHITQGRKYGKKSDDNNCFITSACIQHYNLADDCYQLSTLRNFRNTYLRSSADGNKLIRQYYSIAPKIVKLLNQHPDKNKIYQWIFRQINYACSFIERGKYNKAKNLYVTTVAHLANYFQLI